MPYLNGKYLTDDEVTEREMAARAQYQDFSEREMDARAQYQDREAAPIRSMYQPEGSQRPDIPGDWRPERTPGPYGRPWGSPNYGAPLTQDQMRREADERAIRARNRAAGQSDPAFDYERPRGGRDIPMPEVPQGPWGGPVGPLPSPEAQQGPRQASGTLQPPLQASGRRARAIAREAFAARQRAQQAGRVQGRQGGRRGRPASHPGGGRGGFRLGDLLGGFGGRAFSRGSTLSRVPQAVVGGMAGGAPRAALGGWMGGRR
jgi:hypothetical protein